MSAYTKLQRVFFLGDTADSEKNVFFEYHIIFNSIFFHAVIELFPLDNVKGNMFKSCYTI